MNETKNIGTIKHVTMLHTAQISSFAPESPGLTILAVNTGSGPRKLVRLTGYDPVSTMEMLQSHCQLITPRIPQVRDAQISSNSRPDHLSFSHLRQVTTRATISRSRRLEVV
jgi:hypothetical protein